MSISYTDYIIETIKNEYPNAHNKDLARKLNMSESTLRSKASKLKVKKSNDYMDKVYKKMQKHRKLELENSYKDYKMDRIERNIIIGSLLGDGSLSLYGRSKNAYYRESTGTNQIEYRQWKARMLKNLDFKIKKCGSIYSPSHPIYTELYNLFYPQGVKVIPKKSLQLLDHPIGLACLFMDDGSLVINNYKKATNITLFPQIFLSSQSFTKDENILLKNHLKDIFNIEFSLSKRRDGTNYLLVINKRNEVHKLIDIIKPHVETIPCMKYKIDIKSKLIETQKRYMNKFDNKSIKISSKYATNIKYSKSEEMKICEMVYKGYSYVDIANCLNRPYHGLYNKVVRMKKEGKI